MICILYNIYHPNIIPLNHMFCYSYSNQGSRFGPLQICFDRQRGLLATLQMPLEATWHVHHGPGLDAHSHTDRCVRHESSGNGIVKQKGIKSEIPCMKSEEIKDHAKCIKKLFVRFFVNLFWLFSNNSLQNEGNALVIELLSSLHDRTQVFVQ